MMKKSTFIRLQPNESKVYHAASRIYASYIASNRAHQENDEQMMLKAVESAIKLAELTDSMVQSDDELN